LNPWKNIGDRAPSPENDMPERVNAGARSEGLSCGVLKAGQVEAGQVAWVFPSSKRALAANTRAVRKLRGHVQHGLPAYPFGSLATRQNRRTILTGP
jgi:hypothetical protein